MAPGKYFGTNGVRFRPGIDVGPEFPVCMAQAIGAYYGSGPVLLGFDGRNTGPQVERAVAAGLMSVGIDVLEAGLLPTPALQFATKKLLCRGGVMCTASHNPSEYNGIKVMGSDGVEISRDDEAKIENFYDTHSYQLVDWKRTGRSTPNARALDTYVNSVLQQVDKDSIRKRRFTIVLDPGNGAQALSAPLVAGELGCEVLTINSEVDGSFPGRGAEPLPHLLIDLSDRVKAAGADLGVAYDGDGDRSVFCDEAGVVHWGDKSGCFLVDYLLRRNPGAHVVTTVSTTQAVDEVVEKNGGRVIRTRVGSVEVSRTMLQNGALIGLEENGGFFYGPHIPVRDGAMTTALVLEALSSSNKAFSEILSSLPRFHQRKAKFPCPGQHKTKVMKELTSRARGEVDTTDGVKIRVDPRSWILIRPSGTEPLLRMFAESDDKKKLDDFVSSFSILVEEVLKKVGRG